jgi:hypothetical protein
VRTPTSCPATTQVTTCRPPKAETTRALPRPARSIPMLGEVGHPPSGTRAPPPADLVPHGNLRGAARRPPLTYLPHQGPGEFVAGLSRRHLTQINPEASRQVEFATGFSKTGFAVTVGSFLIVESRLSKGRGRSAKLFAESAGSHAPVRLIYDVGPLWLVDNSCPTHRVLPGHSTQFERGPTQNVGGP